MAWFLYSRIAYLSGGFSVAPDPETGVLGFERCTVVVGPERAKSD